MNSGTETAHAHAPSVRGPLCVLVVETDAGDAHVDVEGRVINANRQLAEILGYPRELEITESCLMEDPEDAVRVMANLRAAGLRISIDDFGTGYSSLSYLTRLPLTALKIDRAFVANANASSEAAAIVGAVIDLAHNLHLTVIAEGVETAEQVEFLRLHGCDQAQGYLFSRPVPAAEITRRLQQHAAV